MLTNSLFNKLKSIKIASTFLSSFAISTMLSSRSSTQQSNREPQAESDPWSNMLFGTEFTFKKSGLRNEADWDLDDKTQEKIFDAVDKYWVPLETFLKAVATPDDDVVGVNKGFLKIQF